MWMLIADSGSTKTQWALVNSDNHFTTYVTTQGINPFYQSSDDIFVLLENELFPSVSEHYIEKIFFYGAGCSQPDKTETVYQALQQLFPQASIIVEHDLLAAARALCGRQAGIACILGTGSNSCLFNGSDIVDNIPSLGFMLGDEASGAYFGKKLLQAYFYRELPHELSARLQHEYQVQKEEVLHQVYHQPNPNRYVASFMPFINQHSHHHYIRSLLADGFNEFIVKFVLKYEGCRQLPVHFTGSVAFLNKEILITALQQHALHAGNIIKSPVEGLVSYHLHITV